MGITRVIRRNVLVALLLLLAAETFFAPAAAQSSGSVYVLTLVGTISPPAASYVAHGITEAEQHAASAVVLQLDTPGGLDTSTRQIVQAIDNSTVPVIVYVAPPGARAASAGTFIGMAAHVLAMAPGTTIGSATPVSLSITGNVQDLPPDLRNKVVNEAVSYIRAHAEIRGRNADWAETAVSQGANLDATQAVAQNVADLMAPDLGSLLTEVNGRQVALDTGQTVVLQTANAPVVYDNMSFINSFLHVIADPNLAFILLALAAVGIFIEIAHPGLIFPGVLGGVSLVLAFYALGSLDAYWGGILLVLLAFGLLIAEAIVPSHGILGLSGIAALLAGGSLLFLNAPPGVSVSALVLWSVTGVAAAMVWFVVRAVLQSRRRNLAPMGYDSLVGEVGVAKTPLSPDGYVMVHGERWRAHLEGGQAAAPGEEVIVQRAAGMDVWVTKKKESELWH